MSAAVPSATALGFRRQRADKSLAAPMLGGRWLGAEFAANAGDVIQAELLFAREPTLDAWVTDRDVLSRRHGLVRYTSDGHWLHGVAHVDERAVEGGLQAATQQAYADLFTVLSSSPCPHLMRVWNYFADINDASGGLERYRQFNIGRQQAFIDAGRSAFDGAPAACTLGTRGGPLSVYFLAGRNVPRAIENPRQVSAYRYPDRYGPRSPSFSRAVRVEAGAGRQVLFISGTASIVGHATVHAGDVRRQTLECLTNIDAVLDEARRDARSSFAASDLNYTINLRHRADAPLIRELFEAHVGGGGAAARDAVYLLADICRADLLVEIEAHGFAPVEDRA